MIKNIDNFDYLERMQSLLKDDFDSYVSSISDSSKKGLRVNTLKLSVDDYLKLNPFKLSPVPSIDVGFFYEDESSIGTHPYHHAGLYYSQEPASMMPVNALSKLGDFEGEIALDLCSAPGGKTTQLAALVGDSGLVVSNEIVPKRAQILRGNVERLGLKNVVVTCTNILAFCKNFVSLAKLVVVDAPCSGEGMFRKNDKAILEWNIDSVKTNAVRQSEILECAYTTLKSNGYMVYSTCTFSLEEDEGVVVNFLSRHNDMELVAVDNSIENISKTIGTYNGVDVTPCRRFYPQDNVGEGQFFAVFKKIGEESSEIKCNFRLADTSGNESILAKKFLKETLGHTDFTLGKLGGQVFILPERKVGINKLPVLSVGVDLGEYDKGVFKPHHHFFMAYGDKVKNKLDLSLEDIRVAKFLRGESIEDDSVSDGYVAILVSGYPIGFGKAKGGIIKNHYPKGIRNLT